MKMKKQLTILMALLLCLSLFTACQNKDKPTPGTEATDTEYYGNSINFVDGSTSFDFPVEDFDKEITLPESKNTNPEEGTFQGWIVEASVYQPGDTIVADEMTFVTALRSDPNAGTLLCLDKEKGTYFLQAYSGEMEISTPYTEFDYEATEKPEDGSEDNFFDYWVDDAGNKYEGCDSITIKNDDVLILTSVYSTDLSNAYRVDVYYNTGDSELDQDYHRYVKKGFFLPLMLMFEPAGYHFDGWYDAPEGGNLLAQDMDNYTPKEDTKIYGHWTKK
ncbi:MAG: hypothetical protein Q4E53_05085 [Eubacteriales bacterium]|nr:hypothetical protein [Eubacteriales bacterium]